MARKAGLHVIEGPAWNAKPPDEGFPPWYRDHLKAVEHIENVYYICRADGTVEAVERSFANPPISRDNEAQLLGYPPCCVRAHYHRAAVLDRTFLRCLSVLRTATSKKCSGSCERTQNCRLKHPKKRLHSGRPRNLILPHSPVFTCVPAALRTHAVLLASFQRSMRRWRARWTTIWQSKSYSTMRALVMWRRGCAGRDRRIHVFVKFDLLLNSEPGHRLDTCNCVDSISLPHPQAN